MMFRDRAVRLKIPVLQLDGEYVYQFGQPPSGAEGVAQRFAGPERFESGFVRERIAAPRTGTLCADDSKNPAFWKITPYRSFAVANRRRPNLWRAANCRQGHPVRLLS